LQQNSNLLLMKVWIILLKPKLSPWWGIEWKLLFANQNCRIQHTCSMLFFWFQFPPLIISYQVFFWCFFFVVRLATTSWTVQMVEHTPSNLIGWLQTLFGSYRDLVNGTSSLSIHVLSVVVCLQGNCWRSVLDWLAISEAFTAKIVCVAHDWSMQRLAMKTTSVSPKEANDFSPVSCLDSCSDS